MNIKYSLNKYIITYNKDAEWFELHHPKSDPTLIKVASSGRVLGRLAWDMDAEEVCYDYDLALDEYLPLHEKYKARNRVS